MNGLHLAAFVICCWWLYTAIVAVKERHKIKRHIVKRYGKK